MFLQEGFGDVVQIRPQRLSLKLRPGTYMHMYIDMYIFTCSSELDFYCTYMYVYVHVYTCTVSRQQKFCVSYFLEVRAGTVKVHVYTN